MVFAKVDDECAYTSSHLASQLGVCNLVAHREQIVPSGVEFHGIVPYMLLVIEVRVDLQGFPTVASSVLGTDRHHPSHDVRVVCDQLIRPNTSE